MFVAFFVTFISGFEGYEMLLVVGFAYLHVFFLDAGFKKFFSVYRVARWESKFPFLTRLRKYPSNSPKRNINIVDYVAGAYSQVLGSMPETAEESRDIDNHLNVRLWLQDLDLLDGK